MIYKLNNKLINDTMTSLHSIHVFSLQQCLLHPVTLQSQDVSQFKVGDFIKTYDGQAQIEEIKLIEKDAVKVNAILEEKKQLMFLPTYLMEANMQDVKYKKAVYVFFR